MAEASDGSLVRAYSILTKMEATYSSPAVHHLLAILFQIVNR